VVGTGGAEIRAPANGWPPAVKLRLHGFRPLASLRADAFSASGALDSQLICAPARSWTGTENLECTLAGKSAGKPSVQGDTLELELPAAMLGPDTARVEVRWAEEIPVASR